MLIRYTIIVFLHFCIFYASNLQAQNYLMSNASVNDCSGSFFDSGGPSGNYGDDQNFTKTFCNDGSGLTHIRLEFSGTDLAPGDVLCFYDGPDANAPLLSCAADYDPGEPFIVQATAANPGGCITVTFVSDGTGAATGWNAIISCIRSCQTVNSELVSTNPVMSPADTGWIDVCPGERVFFTGAGIYPQNGIIYQQSDFSSSFEWAFGDGGIAYGPSVSHAFDDPGGYYVSLYVTDTLGCRSTNLIHQRVRVAPRPVFQLNLSTNNTICAGDTISLAASVASADSVKDVVVLPGGGTFNAGGSRSDSLALPDGTGIPYETSIFFSQFLPGQSLTNVNDLLSICVNIEHSWLRDVEISIFCPNGTEVVLHNFAGQMGGQTFLGEPVDNDGLNPTPGLGYDYCWTPNATNGTWLETANGGGTGGTLPPGDYSAFESFDNLLGCPLNGEWTIRVIDSWPSDNGYIFNWSINFATVLFPDIETFSPALVNWNWTNNPTVFYSSPDSIACAPQNAGTAGYIFTVTDDFGCVWDTLATYNILPPTHPSCYSCDESFMALQDATVCAGDSVQLDASYTGPFPREITFETYPDYLFGAATHPHVNPYYSSVNVNSLGYTTVGNALTDINAVCVDIETDFDSDLNILLRSPSGQLLELSTGNGGSGDNYKITCFKPNAATAVTAGTAPFNGDYKPEGLWSSLTGATANGAWSLRVSDCCVPNKFSKLKWWSISFNATNTTTYSWTNAASLSCNNCPDPFADPLVTTTYILNTNDNYMCTHSDTVTVSIGSAIPAPTNLASTVVPPNGLVITWDAVPGVTNYEVNIDNAGWIPANGTLSHSLSGLANGITINVQVRAFTTTSCSVLIASGIFITTCELEASLTSTLPASCFNTPTGSAFFQVLNAISPLTFTLDASPTVYPNASLSNVLSAGNHEVYFLDGAGCMDTVAFTITSPPAVDINTSFTNAVCNGQDNGTGTTNATGGNGGFTYIWQECTGGSTLAGPNQNALGAGCYYVIATDINGCAATDTIDVGQNTAIQLAFTHTPALCAGAPNGSATVTASGGVEPYTYLWDSGAMTPTANNLTPMFHSVTVTDANDCMATILENVTSPPLLNVDSVVISNPGCFGGTNGTAQVFVTGGTSPYSYSYFPAVGQSTALITGLSSGVYKAYVEDANGCQDSSSFVLNAPFQLSAAVNNVNAEKCAGACDGTANINIVNGTTPYTLDWGVPNVPSTATSSTSLCAGAYVVTITDANSCSVTVNFNINPGNDITIQVSGSAPTCFGETNGNLQASAFGGMPPMNYAWSNGASTQNISNIGCGTFQVTATDQNGCKDSSFYELICPPEIIIDSLVTTDVICFGNNNGQATVYAQGGTGQLFYSWSDLNGQTNSNAINLVANLYSVTVSDANGCTQTSNGIVAQPLALFSSLTSMDVICFGDSTGSISANTSGGVTPYTYNWDGFGVDDENLQNIPAGVYGVTVTDANACTVVLPAVTISQPASPVQVTALQTKISCAGADQSEASALASGGNGAPFTYIWSNLANTPVAGNLAPGSYQVTASDNKGCIDTISVAISQYDSINATIVTTQPSCYAIADGQIVITTVSGGDGLGIMTNYSYNWSVPNPPTATVATGLVGGSYTLTITDNASCAQEFEIALQQPIEILPIFTIDSVTCFGLADGSISILTIVGGQLPFVSTTWSQGATGNTITDLSAGTYTLSLTDSNGCTSQNDAIVHEPALLEIGQVFTEAPYCFGDTNGIISVSIKGGTKDYAILWSNDSTDFVLNGILAGTYYLTVTDANNCAFQDSAILLNPAPLDVQIAAQDPSCYGARDGRFTIVANGGVMPYRYSLDGLTFGGAATMIGLAHGDYAIQIKDGRNCTTTVNAQLVNPLPVQVLLPPDTTLLFGDSLLLSPEIANAFGITQNDWKGGYSDSIVCLDAIFCDEVWVKPTFTNTYTLTVIDENGCTATDAIKIDVEKPKEVFVPTGFTPNDDFENDVLFVYGKTRTVQSILIFRVFDRWGNQVYEATNVPINTETIGWDGTVRGQLANQGVYAWYLEVLYKDGDVRVEKGNTTLIR